MAAGNGDTKFQITTMDMGGWLRVFLAAGHPVDLPVFLSQTLSEWFRERPHLRMRCLLPVCKDGDTVELHARFDAHIFAATGNAPQGK